MPVDVPVTAYYPHSYYQSLKEFLINKGLPLSYFVSRTAFSPGHHPYIGVKGLEKKGSHELGAASEISDSEDQEYRRYIYPYIY